MNRHEISRIFILVGLLVHVVSMGMALQGQEPFATWFFSFAWWSYIFVVDGWVYRHKGESLLLTYPRRFLFYAMWSILLWFIFEVFNLRLQNWFYSDLPTSNPARWLGYFLAFSTVVPGLMETADLIDSAGIVGIAKVKPIGWKSRMDQYFVGLGILFLLLSLLWPLYFFPLVWGGFVFLLDPLNEYLGESSLLTDWRRGRLKRFFHPAYFWWDLRGALGVFGILWPGPNGPIPFPG